MTIDDLRQRLSQLVSAWQEGVVGTIEVHETAEELMVVWDWKQLPKHEAGSVVNEVLSQLDALNVQLILPEDIPAILGFLTASAGAELQAWVTWEAYWEAVDFDERKARLRNDPYYTVVDL
jgi:hypothetical protein